MRKCKTINGLKKAVKKGEACSLKVWGIMDNCLAKGGSYLNLGKGDIAM